MDGYKCRYYIRNSVGDDYCEYSVKPCKSDCHRIGCNSCSFRAYSIAQEPCKSCERKDNKHGTHYIF